MERTRICVLATLCFLSLATNLSAQQSMQLQVRDVGGKAVSDATLHLRHFFPKQERKGGSTLETVAELPIDDQGAAEIKIEPGWERITLAVNADGFAAQEITWIANADELPAEHSFELKPYRQPLVTNDAVVLGMLALVLGFVFYTKGLGGKWDKFYTFFPIILMCYLLPSLLNSFGVISSKESNLWTTAKNYFLPISLILMTLSIDLKAVLGLGSKALIMFFTATIGIVIGGPLAVLIVGTFSPETVGGVDANAVWRGLATLAGSWIGGGANQTAMLEIYGYNPERYSAMVAIDIVVANLWMAFLLYGAGNPTKLDRWLNADTSSIDELKEKLTRYSETVARPATTNDYILLAAVTLVGVGLSHFLADTITQLIEASESGLKESVLASHFFWVVVVATTYGLGLSFTRARELEGAGASKLGTLFIFLLVTVIGTKMDVFAVFSDPILFLVGIVWMLLHTLLLFVVAKFIRAPFFFIAVGSKANVGGAASAPVLAAAFHPSLAPVGVLLAVLGYALGTYGAILCAELMRLVAPV